MLRETVKIQIFSVCPLIAHVHSVPIMDIPRQGGKFVTIGEPTLTHRNHLKSIV